MLNPRTAEDCAPVRAIEQGFPVSRISQLAEKESWRKELGRPLYHIHKWWATRLGSVFRAIVLGAVSDGPKDLWSEFYKRHALNDKVVLDPFMGSGTTLGEALKLGCSVIGCDINPVSAFSVRQALQPVDEQALRDAFTRLEQRVSAEILRYYTTLDPATGQEIRALYYFWVKEVEVPGGEVIPLFSSYVFARNAYAKKNPRAQIVCPSCWNVFSERFDVLNAICPSCHHEFNPQDGAAKGQYVTDRHGRRHKVKDCLPADGSPPKERMYAILALREDGSKTYLPVGDYDLALFEEASQRLKSERLPLPDMPVRPGYNTNQARGYGFTRWSDFFNDRHKLCLGLLLREIMAIEDRTLREQFICLFSSTLEFNNRFCSFKGEGTGAVRHMFSHHILKPERTPLENSVWGTKKSSGTFSTLFESRLIPAKRYLTRPFELTLQEPFLEVGAGSGDKVIASESLSPKLVSAWPLKDSGSALVLNGDSGNLPLPDKIVDAVVTDPPYFDFIHYSELSDFFYAWLAMALGKDDSSFSLEHSGSEDEVQQKDVHVFAERLGRVFSECCRVMKDEAVLCFSFHHSRPEGWRAVYEALELAGLRTVAVHALHAELRAARPKTAAHEPISLDAILVCKKREVAATVERTDPEIVARVLMRSHELMRSGMSLSNGDLFVIASGELLASVGEADASEFERRLVHLKARLAICEASEPV